MTEIIYYILLIVFSLWLIRNISKIFSPNKNIYKSISEGKPIVRDNAVRFIGVGGLLLSIYVLVWIYSIIF